MLAQRARALYHESVPSHLGTKYLVLPYAARFYLQDGVTREAIVFSLKHH